MNFYAYLIVAYLVGGIPFGLIVGFLSGHGDIRQQGSGNIGATNVMRIAGIIPTIFVFIGDIGKGIAAVLLCQYFFQPGWPISYEAASLLAGFLAVMGHSFSPYLKFRGGKGVNTALGVFISVLPIQSLIAVSVFVVIVAITRYVSLGSLVATISLTGLVWAQKLFMDKSVANAYVIATSFVCFLIIITHRQNIKRLLAGNENRFQMRKAVD